ncbi:MAG: PhoH family protein [Deltaproteobacteria bacterium]|nr:PhoH family protein [Deltaproteobacteria bacterium]
MEKTFSCPGSDAALRVFGVTNRNISAISSGLGVKISCRGHDAHISGDEKRVLKAYDLFVQLLESIENGHNIGETDVETALRSIRKNGHSRMSSLMQDVIIRTYRGVAISPKTSGQQKYINAIRGNTLVFGVGPAGTGKTYLAMAMALNWYNEKKVNRIILTRPAVEAGERLGFLPGDLEQKVNPYLRPLYDALNEIFEPARVRGMIGDGSIEVAPLAFMRGRTLKDAFVILDEAQNTSREQMKMFLTRIGDGSHCVVTGDITQIDLPDHRSSGLIEAVGLLNGIDDIAVQHFAEDDVMRHPLVRRIIRAYEENEENF